jgi:hypothetical protein
MCIRVAHLPAVNSIRLSLGLALTVSLAHAAPQIEETIVAPAWAPGTILTLSPSGLHLASTHPKGNGFAVTVDGVEGEPFDEIYNAAIGFEQKFTDDGSFLRSSATWTGPVVFSRDGSRHAYVGRRGKDALVMVDGKEIFRAPVEMGRPPANNLFFSPDGKHLFFHNPTKDSPQSNRLMKAGQPVTPAFEGPQFPIFSRDGSRWALVGSKPRESKPTLLIIDGKDPGYMGERVQFSPDGKRVASVAVAFQKQTLLVDGKPLVGGQSVLKFGFSSTGDIGAIVTLEPGRNQFFINGKLTLDTTSDFLFSPDGKRWAAVQGLNREFSVVVDGKKDAVVSPGPQHLQFSPDSTRYVYVVERTPSYHVVLDGKESEAFRVLDRRPLFGETGNGVIYVGGSMIGRMKVYHNDHIEPEEQRPVPGLSPDGKRFAYFGKGSSGDQNFNRLILDKEMKSDAKAGPILSVVQSGVMFSPDSKHLVAQLHQALWLDHQAVKVLFTPLGFTSDSRNLVLSNRITDSQGQPTDLYFVNGDEVARFSGRGMQFSGTRPKVWEAQPDGRVIFIGHTPGGLSGYGPIKRVVVTPDPAASATSWVNEVKASEEKAAADAVAAKQKAADDVIAAAAKKKADADAALAKRKADAQAAAEAKKKAAADAAAARAAAKQKK